MLLKPRYVGRFRDAAGVLARHGFADLLARLDLARYVPGGDARSQPADEREQERADKLRLAFEELGATYVKLGQILSTRPDLLPSAYVDALQHLQDRVEPFDSDAVRAAVEEELGQPLDAVFGEFDTTPLASASLAQVHRAVLVEPLARDAGFAEVAVKVLRPGVEAQVELDVEILEEVARFVGTTQTGERYDLPGLVEQLGRSLREELDLSNEARNARRMREALSGYSHLSVPRIVGALSAKRVLTAERVEGTRIDEVDGESGPTLARELWRFYLELILVEGFFHADPHPGNFLVDASGTGHVLDHGSVGHISPEGQLRLMSLLLALADRAGERAADACLEIGVPGPGLDRRAFRREVAQLVARHAGLPLAELEIGRLFLDIALLAYRNGVRIPPEITLLGKTLLSLEAVCRRLDPDLDPVSTMREMAAPLLRQQLARQATQHRALSAALEARAAMAQVPGTLRRLLNRLANDELRVGVRVEESDRLQGSVEKIASRVTLGLITASLIVGSALMLNIEAGPQFGGYPVFGLLGFGLAAGLGVYLVVRILISDQY